MSLHPFLLNSVVCSLLDKLKKMRCKVKLEVRFLGLKKSLEIFVPTSISFRTVQWREVISANLGGLSVLHLSNHGQAVFSNWVILSLPGATFWTDPLYHTLSSETPWTYVKDSACPFCYYYKYLLSGRCSSSQQGGNQVFRRTHPNICLGLSAPWTWRLCTFLHPEDTLVSHI